MRIGVLLPLVLPTVVLAKTVRMDFMVKDDDGHPLAGVSIDSYTKERPVAPYAKARSRRTSCQTDANGRASIAFDTWEGLVDCYFNCDGCYPEKIRDIRFASHFDEKLGDTVVTGDAQSVDVRMRRKVKPVPMIAHFVSKCTQRFPKQGTRFGYDLQKGDWVAPHGKGEVVDFVVVREWCEDAKSIRCFGRLEFIRNGDGAYVVRRDRCRAFPVAYHANPDGPFKTAFDYWYREDKTTRASEADMILGPEEYLVTRTRTVRDSEGKIIKANYSVILGKVFIARYFSLGSWYCNPVVNDTNLEYMPNEFIKP